MTPIKITSEVVCPECGGIAIYTSITEHVAVYTGEMEDETWPAVETVEAHGFTVECSHCGFADAEPVEW